MRLPAEPSDLRGARKCLIIKPLRGSGSRSNIDFERFTDEDKEKYIYLARQLLNR